MHLKVWVSALPFTGCRLEHLLQPSCAFAELRAALSCVLPPGAGGRRHRVHFNLNLLTHLCTSQSNKRNALGILRVSLNRNHTAHVKSEAFISVWETHQTRSISIKKCSAFLLAAQRCCPPTPGNLNVKDAENKSKQMQVRYIHGQHLHLLSHYYKLAYIQTKMDLTDFPTGFQLVSNYPHYGC